jgi:hypothetical protein
MAGIRKYQTTTELGAEIGAAVAAVAAVWSNLELELEHTIKMMGKMPHRTTRVLITGMNARTRLGCIEGLFQLRSPSNPALAREFHDLKEDIEQKAEGERNKVVHAVWHRSKKDEYFIVRTSGAWTPPGRKGKIKRAVQAELEPIDARKIRVIARQIDDLLLRLRAWQAKL